MSGENPAIEVFTSPLAPKTAGELVAFWATVFDEPFDRLLPVLAGREREFNDDTVYLVRRGGVLTSTCRLTVSRADRRFALLGEVATGEEFRGHGLAHRLCERARDDFRQGGGRAIFLATVNPAARRVYESLGWARLPTPT